jgi:hypothetical protein
MKLLRTNVSVSMIAAAALVAVLASATTSSAFTLRSPQVAIGGSSLQSYLNGVGESINVNTDQLDAQVWSSNVSGNAEFTLMIELAGNAAQNAIGVYNSQDPFPVLFQVFPGAASAGWFATAHFAGGNLVVTLFDQNSVFQGQSTYNGVSSTHFGFYLNGPGGLFYSQDSRNAGSRPQMLTYAGTGTQFGDWWECFEDLSLAGGSDSDYEDAVLLLQSVVPTPAHTTSFGKLKSLYR